MSIVTRKSAREIDLMRHAGAIVAEVLALVESELRPGVTTAHLDELGVSHEGVKDIGAGHILEFRDPDNIALELYAAKA